MTGIRLIGELFNYEILSEAPSQSWGHSEKEAERNLYYAFVFEFFFTILSINCPISVGVFVPVVGASLGRIYAI